MQAGLHTEYLTIEEIGYDQRIMQFVDLSDRPISCAFKLYPWSGCLRTSSENTCRFKNEMARGSLENTVEQQSDHGCIMGIVSRQSLSAREFDAALSGDYVQKPCQSREGQGVEISVRAGCCRGQGYQLGIALPAVMSYSQVRWANSSDRKLDGEWLCSRNWIREDDGLITGNDSRFVPHFFS